MKNPPEVKTGDRVRVVLEGKARITYNGAAIGTGSATNVVASKAEHVVSVEVLPPPVEVFGPGDTVRDKVGGVVRTLGRGGYFNYEFNSWHVDASVANGRFTSEHYERVRVRFFGVDE